MSACNNNSRNKNGFYPRFSSTVALLTLGQQKIKYKRTGETLYLRKEVKKLRQSGAYLFRSILSKKISTCSYCTAVSDCTRRTAVESQTQQKLLAELVQEPVKQPKRRKPRHQASSSFCTPQQKADSHGRCSGLEICSSKYTRLLQRHAITGMQVCLA